MKEEERQELLKYYCEIVDTPEEVELIKYTVHKYGYILPTASNLKDICIGERTLNLHFKENHENNMLFAPNAMQKFDTESRIKISLDQFIILLENKTLKKFEVPVPEITLEKDSIAHLSKRLIDLYMKEHGLKCKISVEPFESSYK